MFLHDLLRRGRQERRPPRQHLVEGGAERVNIGPGIDVRVPHDLLGRDVVRRTEGLADLIEARVIGLPRQAHIGQLGHAFAGEHDVLGFDVAVDEAARMRVGQGLGDLDRDLEGPLLGHRVAQALELIVQGRAVNELLDEVGVAVDLAGVDGLDDVVVGELGGRAGLLHEAPPRLGVARGLRQEHLDGHDPVDRDLPGLVHDGLAAAPDPLQEFDARNLERLRREGLFFEGGQDAADLPVGHDAGLEDRLRKVEDDARRAALGLDGPGLLDVLFGDEAPFEDVLLETSFGQNGHASRPKFSAPSSKRGGPRGRFECWITYVGSI